MDYVIHLIPKYSNGKYVGQRVLEEPTPELKMWQKRTAKELAARFALPSCVHGVRATSTVSNSNPHVGKLAVYKLDLKDYYHTVTRDKLEKLELGIDLEKVLHDNRLPTGGPSSPILANLAFVSLDKQIIDLIKDLEINYTRYMDDLTFSSNKLEHLTPGLCQQIISLIEVAGFQINRKKSGLKLNFQQQKVTGIVVNQKLGVGRQNKNLLRAKLDHHARTGSNKLTKELEGDLAYAKAVDAILGRNLSSYFHRRVQFYSSRLEIKTSS